MSKLTQQIGAAMKLEGLPEPLKLIKAIALCKVAYGTVVILLLCVTYWVMQKAGCVLSAGGQSCRVGDAILSLGTFPLGIGSLMIDIGTLCDLISMRTLLRGISQANAWTFLAGILLQFYVAFKFSYPLFPIAIAICWACSAEMRAYFKREARA